MALRVRPADTPEQVEMVTLAARLCGTPLTVSIDPADPKVTALEAADVKVHKESLSEFIASMFEYERIRTCSPDIPYEVFEAAAAADKYIATAPPVHEGRVELVHYIKEQSISFEYHRYGSITEVPSIK
jgi:RHH-type proline utilization regulon transcriptional repressor/proline dehydrogenase/delta 1-pyrroline-5-carboxylate dehydrogenase